MSQFSEFFSKLMDVSDWPPRWVCGTWSDFHGWLYIGSDVTIWLAYFIIPVILVWFIQKKPEIPFHPVFWLFGAFIILCGATHLMDAIIFWWPNYRISAIARFVTAVVSMATVFALIRHLPKALSLKPSEDFVNEQRKYQISERAWKDELFEKDVEIENLKRENMILKERADIG